MPKVTALTQDLCAYLLRHHTPESRLLRELRRETHQRLGDKAKMMISEDQGMFLRILVAALGPRLALEVGTFTGYSALCMASALPPGGKLICCDLDAEWTSIGRPYWRRGAVADRIDLRVAAALETIASLPAAPAVDFAFLDADKASYIAYYEALLPRMRPNSLMAVDNVLWHNWSMDASDQDAETVGIRAFNDHVLADPRVETVMLHMADGLTLVRKLPEPGEPHARQAAP